MLKIIIITRDLETGKHIERLLEHEGIEQCRVAISFVEASKWELDFQPDCIFFERSLVKDSQTVFQWFDSQSIKFVVLQNAADYLEAIDFPNTGRFVADLPYPVSLKDVQKALADLICTL